MKGGGIHIWLVFVYFVIISRWPVICYVLLPRTFFPLVSPFECWHDQLKDLRYRSGVSSLPLGFISSLQNDWESLSLVSNPFGVPDFKTSVSWSFLPWRLSLSLSILLYLFVCLSVSLSMFLYPLLLLLVTSECLYKED